MSKSPPRPPVPFPDFQFSFDPALSSVFPPAAPVPPSADLFSASETTDLLGFLDDFNWEFDANQARDEKIAQIPPLYIHPQSASTDSPRPSSSTGSEQPVQPRLIETEHMPDPCREHPQSHTSDNSGPSNQLSRAPSYPSGMSVSPASDTSPSHAASHVKPLLSTPQKRLNHILSEQKRRNAIRDGYAQLITLLAPAGAPGINMPTRGRPKGSGSRGKGQTKGKSGVLFRAVEYCQWLEEGNSALRAEVLRVETAVGIRQS